MIATLALAASCSLSSWPVVGSKEPSENTYPQWRWCPLKLVQDQGGGTAFPIDEHHYVTARDGTLVTLPDPVGMHGDSPLFRDAVDPCPLGFIDRPLGIDFSAHAGTHVWIPWVGGYVARQHMVDATHLALALPPEAIGAPVLRACGDCYPPSGAGGYDSVVGIVTGSTSIAGLDDLYALPGVHPWPNLDFADGHGAP